MVEELITKRLDEGSAIGLTDLDFPKAFDSVNHRLLLHKLRGYGIAPIVIIWVECFFSRRTFQVNVNRTLSQMAEAISGVPQGSVIGPILFVIYVSDLPTTLKQSFGALTPIFFLPLNKTLSDRTWNMLFKQPIPSYVATQRHWKRCKSLL